MCYTIAIHVYCIIVCPLIVLSMMVSLSVIIKRLLTYLLSYDSSVEFIYGVHALTSGCQSKQTIKFDNFIVSFNPGECIETDEIHFVCFNDSQFSAGMYALIIFCYLLSRGHRTYTVVRGTSIAQLGKLDIFLTIHDTRTTLFCHKFIGLLYLLTC